MKKLIALFCLAFILASPAVAAVDPPPKMNIKSWTMDVDVDRCFVSGLHTRAERFYETDPALFAYDNRLYEERSEDGAIMIVRYAEWKNGVPVLDDIYLLNGTWAKFSLLTEAEEFKVALWSHPNFYKWAGVAEAPCSK